MKINLKERSLGFSKLSEMYINSIKNIGICCKNNRDFERYLKLNVLCENVKIKKRGYGYLSVIKDNENIHYNGLYNEITPRGFSFDDILITDDFKNNKHRHEIIISTIYSISHNKDLLLKFQNEVEDLCGM